MTLEELQRIVLRLSNQAWTRYWIHWNYPATPSIMGIGIYALTPGDFDRLKKEFADLGFTYHTNAGNFDLWTIQRIEEE